MMMPGLKFQISPSLTFYDQYLLACEKEKQEKERKKMKMKMKMKRDTTTYQQPKLYLFDILKNNNNNNNTSDEKEEYEAEKRSSDNTITTTYRSTTRPPKYHIFDILNKETTTTSVSNEKAEINLSLFGFLAKEKEGFLELTLGINGGYDQSKKEGSGKGVCLDKDNAKRKHIEEPKQLAGGGHGRKRQRLVAVLQQNNNPIRDIVIYDENNINNQIARLVFQSDRFVIKKILESSDVNKLSRLLLGRDFVEFHINPYLKEREFQEVMSGRGIRVRIWDHDTNDEHELTFKYQLSMKEHVFISNWRYSFVTRRELKDGDEIGMFWYPKDEIPRLVFKVLRRAIPK